MLAVFGASSGHCALAVLLMLRAVVCEDRDGTIGRWLGTPHPCGKARDALADCIGSGIAPAVFVYTYATPQGWLTLALVCSYCAVSSGRPAATACTFQASIVGCRSPGMACWSR
jgi:phosphatidylserine synthase